MSLLTMRLKGKRPVPRAEARAILERELRSALKRAGFILQGSLMRNSPVRSGTLRRSWSVGEPEWRGDVFALKVGTVLVYAAVVDARGKSAGYIARSREQARAQVHEAIRAALKAALPQMWVAA